MRFLSDFGSFSLNESLFDKYTGDLAKDNKDIGKLKVILSEYENIKKKADNSRLANNNKAAQMVDPKEKAKIDAANAEIDKNETNQMNTVEKKLIAYMEGKSDVVHFYIQSKIDEIKNNVLKNDLKMDKSMSDGDIKRMKDEISDNDQALQARVQKLLSLVKDPTARTGSYEVKINSLEKKAADKAADLNSDGTVSPEERKAAQLKATQDKTTPLGKYNNLALKKLKAELTKKYTPPV